MRSKRKIVAGVAMALALLLDVSAHGAEAVASAEHLPHVAHLPNLPNLPHSPNLSHLPQLPYAASAASRAPDARRQGALFRVTRNKQVSYLFGTVHVGTTAFYPLAPEVRRALADAGQLVVELDTRASDAFARAVDRHGSYRGGDSVRQHLSSDTLARLTAALHAQGISVSSVAHLKPWLLANLLMGLELERHGYRRSQGVESVLLTSAQRQGTAVAELESADYQLALFDTLGHADGERYLREALLALSDGSSLRRARAVMTAWSSGDAAALDALIADATDGDSVMAAFTRSTLLGRRNPEMAARIEQIMQHGHTTFVGVGLLHLLGANGLPQLLSRRGYQVERMY